MRLDYAAALLAVTFPRIAAQRPSNESICDWYALVKYGESNATTQFDLMQSIIAFAWGGGSKLFGASSTSTGVLNPGTFEGTPVNLRSWFDGSKATTNLNNQPIGINWLDNGAQDPLIAYLNGSTSSVVLSKTSNQYRLFIHFFTAFGYIFGCTHVRDFPSTSDSGGPLSLAYVHKFMNLNQTDLGHLINQITTASRYFGFSTTDASTLSISMNAKYNVRCAPPVNGQLYSLCQATECPLAEPSPDCAPYADLGPSGIGNSTTPAQTSPPSTSSVSTTVPTFTQASATPAPATPTSDTSLGAGAIAGIAIGGAAVLLLAVGLWLYSRRRARPQIVSLPVSAAGFSSPPHLSYSPNPRTSYPPDQHRSYLEQTGFWGPKPDEVVHGAVEPVGHYDVGRREASPTQIAEMESPRGSILPPGVPAATAPAQGPNWSATGGYGGQQPHRW